MNVERYFLSADRYLFDFKVCTYAKGFAQIDTSQDASYFGTWTNPTELKTVSYTEGDVVEKVAQSEQEYIEELLSLKAWNDEMGYSCHIDPGFKNEMKNKFIELGLEAMLH